MKQPYYLQQNATVASRIDLKDLIQILKVAFPVLYTQSHRIQREFGKGGWGEGQTLNKTEEKKKKYFKKNWYGINRGTPEHI